MPSPAESLASAAVLWLALALVLPKRGWGTMRRRLRAAGLWRARHAFGPPVLAAGDVSPAGFSRILAAEVPAAWSWGSRCGW